MMDMNTNDTQAISIITLLGHLRFNFKYSRVGLAYRYRPIQYIGRYGQYRQNRYIGIGSSTSADISADMTYR